MDQERFDQITRTHASGMSRRGVLRALGVGGAGGILVVVRQVARAGERPLDRVQQRTPQRNRKQRKNNQNNNTSDGGGGGRLGSSQPGTGQNGQLGSTDSLLCGYQCEDAITACEYACFNASSGSANPDPACYDVCLSQNDACYAACPPA